MSTRPSLPSRPRILLSAGPATEFPLGLCLFPDGSHFLAVGLLAGLGQESFLRRDGTLNQTRRSLSNTHITDRIRRLAGTIYCGAIALNSRSNQQTLTRARDW